MPLLPEDMSRIPPDIPRILWGEHPPRIRLADLRCDDSCPALDRLPLLLLGKARRFDPLGDPQGTLWAPPGVHAVATLGVPLGNGRGRSVLPLGVSPWGAPSAKVRHSQCRPQ